MVDGLGLSPALKVASLASVLIELEIMNYNNHWLDRMKRIIILDE